MAQCAAGFSGSSSETCSLAQNKRGFCCPDVLSSRSSSPVFSTRASRASSSQLPSGISDNDIRDSLSKVSSPRKARGQEDLETRGHRLFTKAKPENRELSDYARKLLSVPTLNLRQGVSADNSGAIRADCPWLTTRKPRCVSEPEYRTVDGSCNNQENPLYGLSGTPLQRILESDYSQGTEPRIAKDGSQLPSARAVSQTAFQVGAPDNKDDISVYFMQMGQFIDHDLTHAPAEEIECCLKDSRQRHWVYPDDPYNGNSFDCFPIEIPRNDKFWGNKGRRCMEFSRSLLTPSIKPPCEANRREQQTQLTHWLDGSNIYGNYEDEARTLRDSSSRSRLKTVPGSAGRDQLPTCARESRRSSIEACAEVCEERQRRCVFAGDFRVNEQPGLTVMHTVWVREHNRIAGELRVINQEWDEEKVFQETRRIVIAEWQHVVYNEWLPVLLGVEYMRAHDLLPLTTGYTRDYSPDLDPRINNEFAAAAFRFGHSMIATHIPERDSAGRNVSTLDLKNTFNNPSFLQQRGFLDNTVRGYTQEQAPAMDKDFTEDVVNHLFEEVEGQGGLDLTALNIQRGRDHGIPGYNQYRKICGSASSNFGEASDFTDLARGGFLSRADVTQLSQLYKHVDDIDLFIGGVLEQRHRDSILGPTFKCIIGDQFIRLKRGDRFWYENGLFSSSRFSEDQLSEIRKASMARILCDNTDLNKIQPLVFKVATGANNFIPCNDGISIPRLNLDVFRA